MALSIALITEQQADLSARTHDYTTTFRTGSTVVTRRLGSNAVIESPNIFSHTITTRSNLLLLSKIKHTRELQALAAALPE